MKAWESGARDPHAISEVWRARVNPETVCAALLEP